MELPGIDDPEDLFGQHPLSTDRDAFCPERVLGKKGLYGKDRATRLALCATQRALLDAGGLDIASHRSCGVLVSCCLGNLDTVCNAAQTIEAGRLNDLSAMELPSASSNIVASTIAIRFKCRGLNVTVCGGADSGTQAIGLASNAILSGRLQRAIVVGAESHTVASEALLAQSFERWPGHGESFRIMEGAAALVLEAADQAVARGARVYGCVDHYAGLPSHDLGACSRNSVSRQSSPPALWLTPNRQYSGVESGIQQACASWPTTVPRLVDLGSMLGEGYGLTGVLQALVASLWLVRHGEGYALTTSGGFCGETYSGCTFAAWQPPELPSGLERVNRE
jgi:3-oxoacyl-[acyl-carrier-protein] synthase II